MGQIEEKIREAVESPVNALAKYVRNLETRIDALTTKIEEFTITSARLNTEIKNLKNEVAANQAEFEEDAMASCAEARIDALTTKIEVLTATSACLNTKIKNLKKEVAANQEELLETLKAVMTDLTVRIGARVDERLQAIERQQPAAQPNVLARWLHR